MPDLIAARARERVGMGIVAASMLVAAVLAAIGLTNHAFWDDEANTAVYARNLLEQGKLTAWDGTNLLSYAYGGGLGDDLGRELRVPGLSACVAALGMWLFGQNTFGGRILFVVAGVLSVGLLAVWARRHFSGRFPWWLPSIILALSPAYLLYIRNCRYYALAILFTLTVWTVWAPGRSGAVIRKSGRLPAWPTWLRYAGGAAAMVLLCSTHYLSAAAVLVTLPLFLFDRRYRQPRQFVLLGIFCATTGAYGAWVLATSSPLGTGYLATEDWLMPRAELSDGWARFWQHLRWLLRDLGTHEFFPWCLAPVLVVPWLPDGWRPTGAKPLRPAAGGGLILLALTLAYVVTAACLTPADMGKGPVAEMRYVVPLLVVGAAVGGTAVAILWRLSRPVAAVALVLLVGTNFLHLGFLAERYDRTRSWWPPTLYRYVAEIFNDYQSGNEELIALLKKLPPGTTVRTYPVYMTHPGIFYAPELHYCDQLTITKPIRPELRRELPDYIYVERAHPEVVFVPASDIGRAMKRLDERFGANSYRLCKTLSGHWNYTTKPELPIHFFHPPKTEWDHFPGLAALVATGSSLTDHEALRIAPDDAEALFRLGATLKEAGRSAGALTHLQAAVRVDPDHGTAHFHLGVLLAARGELDSAIEYYEKAIALHPEYVEAHVNLGAALAQLGRSDEAERHYRTALKIRPESPMAHFNLANLLISRGESEEAMHHLQETLKLDPDYARARVNLGIMLAEKNRLDEAIAHYRAALRVDPGLLEGYVNLAVALAARGDRLEAATWFKVALQIAKPQSPEARWIRQALQDLEAKP